MDSRERIRQKQQIEKKRERNDPERRRKKRLIGMQTIIALCLVGLVVRIGYIQYVHGEEYTRLAMSQQLNGNNNIETLINPNRGSIQDRNKHDLAVSTTVYNIILDIRLLVEEDKKVQDYTIDAINQALEIPVEQIRGYLEIDPETKKPVIDRNYYIIARQVPRKNAMQLQDSGAKHVHLEADTKRKYVHDNLASNAIGFIQGDGNWGLENTYNTELSGEVGRMFRVYGADGAVTTEQLAPREGYTLVTTLDYEIQQIAEDAVKKLGDEYNPENAAVLVMEPNTGEVLAMAQYNSFNLNDPRNPEFFGAQTYKNQWEVMSAEEQLNALYKTWGNFSISTTFEPGSIFKPIVVAAAMEEGIINENSTYYCDVVKVVLDTDLKCWSSNGHGTQSLTDVLKNSCNIGMMVINEQLGREKFFKYRGDFGYGEKTGIDLPGEESVSSPAVMYTLRGLNPVEMATSAMGQGFNNTAIQAITSFSAVINGGNLMKPYIVSQIIDKDGNVIKENSPTVVKKPISKETSDFMRTALHSVVTESGTGRKAIIDGYVIGGKTGTAQQGVRKEGDEGDYTVSFIAYLPVENPEIIAMVVIHKPEEYIEGSTSAAPSLRQVLLDIIKYRNIKPTGEVSPEDNINMEKDSVPMDDLMGMSLVEATRRLNDMQMDYLLVGNGDTVNSHTPEAGAQVPPGSKVFLYISDSGGELVSVPNVIGLSEEQAVNLLVSANLSPIIFVDKDEQIQIETGEPVTQNVNTDSDTAGEYQESSSAEASLDNGNIVYEQMPSSDIRVQSGTQIKLKVN